MHAPGLSSYSRVNFLERGFWKEFSAFSPFLNSTHTRDSSTLLSRVCQIRPLLIIIESRTRLIKLQCFVHGLDLCNRGKFRKQQRLFTPGWFVGWRWRAQSLHEPWVFQETFCPQVNLAIKSVKGPFLLAVRKIPLDCNLLLHCWFKRPPPYSNERAFLARPSRTMSSLVLIWLAFRTRLSTIYSVMYVLYLYTSKLSVIIIA